MIRKKVLICLAFMASINIIVLTVDGERFSERCLEGYGAALAGYVHFGWLDL